MTSSRAAVTNVQRLARVRQMAASGEARAIRLRADVAAATVGGACGVSHNAVLRWERGVRRPSGAAALRYLDVLEALEKVGG